MSERPSWTGSAADLLRISVERSSDRIPRDGTGWPKNPRDLAGHLHRVQKFLRALGIEIASVVKAEPERVIGWFMSQKHRQHRQQRQR